MSSVFNRAYADAYDTLYDEKDYNAECDLLESVFTEFSTGEVRSVVDLGCGTGGHSIRFAQRGYEVVGVDISDEMLGIAKTKASGIEHGSVDFKRGDVRSVNLGRTFDAAVMMFAVLGYQVTNEDLIATLRQTRKHLEVGGIFTADFWYGPAVLSIGPSERFRTFTSEDRTIIRASRGSLDTAQHVCTVSFDLWKIEADRLVENSTEDHLMRYFFPKELEFLLSATGFELVKLGQFPDFDEPVTDSSWNAFVVGRAVA